MSKRTELKVVKVEAPRQKLIKPKEIRSKERGSRSQPGMVLYRKIKDEIKVMRKFRSHGIINSQASGIIALTSFLSSGVTSNPEWSNFSQEFMDYRVRQMVMKLFACYPTAAAATGANDYPIGVMLVSRFWEDVPSSITSLTQSPDLGLFPTNRHHIFTNNFKGYEDGQLWTSTGLGIPSDQVYGIAIASSASNTLLEPSNTIFNLVLEFDVEFMGVR